MKHSENVVLSAWLTPLAAIAGVVAALYLAKDVLVPIALAVLLSFLLRPVCDWLEKLGLARIPAVMATTALAFTLLAIAVWTTLVQMGSLAPKMPEYRRNIEAKLGSLNEYAVAALRKSTWTAPEKVEDPATSQTHTEPKGTDDAPLYVRVVSSPTDPWQVAGGLLGNVFGSLVGLVSTAEIVLVFVVFILFRREDLRDRFIHLAGKGHVTLTTQMLEDAGSRVSRYLLALTLLNVMFGVSVGLGLSLIGVPNALLWGISAAALRYIPYFGPWIAAIMPVALSIAISPGWTATVLSVSLFSALELLNNNFLEPWLYGKNTGVSPVAVLFAAVFWTWIWGPVGLLLATPLTVCILVVGKHVPALAFLDVLLGTEPVFEPMRRVYQRLLAGDQEQAFDLFEDYLKERPLVDVYDEILIPALALAETHWQLGELNDAKHEFILLSLGAMIHDAEARLQQPRAIAIGTGARSIEGLGDQDLGPRSTKRRVLCVPAHTAADELTARMLAHVLKNEGADAEAASIDSVLAVLSGIPDPDELPAVCVSATPPAAMIHARQICKRVRDQQPDIRMVAGLWDVQGDLSKARERVDRQTEVVAKLADAQKHLTQMGAGLSSGL